MSRHTWVCPDCGGKNVNCSATVTWDEEKQEWQIDGELFEDDFCQDCEKPIRMEQVPLPEKISE